MPQLEDSWGWWGELGWSRKGKKYTESEKDGGDWVSSYYPIPE